MRGKMKFGLILLLAVIAIPACGQGQPADKTIAVFGQAIHYFDMVRGRWWCCCTDWGAARKTGCRCWSRWRRNTIAGSRPDRVRAIGQAAAGFTAFKRMWIFLNEFLRQLESGEGEPGGRIAGRVDRRALRGRDRRRSALDTGGEARACRCGRAEAG